MSNKKHKFYYKKKNNSNNQQDTITLDFPSELLIIPTNQLSLSESTIELLAKYKITISGELVMRTEKDMYKIQGLNKKILLEIINALKEKGLYLRESLDLPKNDNPTILNNKSVKNEESNDLSLNKQIKTDKKSKFGLAEKSNKEQNSINIQNQINKNKNVQNEDDKNGLKKVIKGGKWGYSKGNKIVIPTIYDEIFSFKEGLACVEIDEKCGFIDSNNNIIIPLDYDLASSFSEGYAMVSKNNKCGYINKNNELVIPFLYDAATPFEDGEAKVKKDGKWATIDKNNNLTWII